MTIWTVPKSNAIKWELGILISPSHPKKLEKKDTSTQNIFFSKQTSFTANSTEELIARSVNYRQKPKGSLTSNKDTNL